MSSLITWAFVLKKVKIIYFSKTIAAYDLKVGSYTELNDLMKLREYQRSSYFFFSNLNFVFLKKTWVI